MGPAFGQIAPPCGTVLATYRNVPALSNGQCHAAQGGNFCDCVPASGPYGRQFQCVEYVRRFYALAMGFDTSTWGGRNAVDFYASANTLGLEAYENGSTEVSPVPNDIVVFSTPKHGFGHIAVVTDCRRTSSGLVVDIIEQNWSTTGTATLVLSKINGFYNVSSRGSYSVLGWLRPFSFDETTTQPSPCDGQDIWTTSVYCYCPGGGGPGGGLDNDLLRVGGWGDEYYSLVQFDLSNSPWPADVAELHLYCFHQENPTEMYLDRITESWDWRTQGTGPDRLRLWWEDRPAALQWEALSLPAPVVGQWYVLDITELYNAWKVGTYPNYGLQLRPVNFSFEHFNTFYSSDYLADPSLRPKLIVRQIIVPE